MFDIIQSEFKEIKSDFQTTFQLYEDYKNSLKNDIECSEHYLSFYTYFLECVTKYPNIYNKVLTYAVVKYQLKMKSKIHSLSEFEKGNDIFIGDNDTENISISSKMKLDNTTKDVIKIDKRYKEDKNNEYRNWDFGKFPHGRDYKYGWDVTGSVEHISLKCPVPGYKLSEFAEIYNTYPIEIKNKILTNNGKHDVAVTPNWDWVDLSYGSARERKISMNVAIINHITRMQHIDEYPVLLNVNEDYGYILGSRTDHDLIYIPLNWKREMEKSVKVVRAEMDTKL